MLLFVLLSAVVAAVLLVVSGNLDLEQVKSKAAAFARSVQTNPGQPGQQPPRAASEAARRRTASTRRGWQPPSGPRHPPQGPPPGWQPPQGPPPSGPPPSGPPPGWPQPPPPQ